MGLTGQGKFHLSVKEGREGKPFLKLEPTGANKDLLGGGYIALTLREGTTFGEAQALADTMKKQIQERQLQEADPYLSSPSLSAMLSSTRMLGPAQQPMQMPLVAFLSLSSLARSAASAFFRTAAPIAALSSGL